jgi:SAM-dependent methyltransferase
MNPALAGLRPRASRLMRRLARTLGLGPTGTIDWGDLRRVEPVSRAFGAERGIPIDRYYIEQHLRLHRADIKGRVLEIGNAHYTSAFGGARVLKSDVLHVEPGNPEATIVGDLATGANIPRDAFDCLILTQTLSHIYDVRGAIGHAHAALRPGGVVLATFGGVTQISRADADRWGDFWRFTDAAARRLFGDIFGPGNVGVTSHGNVLAVCAFLHGLALHELTQAELDHPDQDYPLVIAVRAVRAARHET